jgi:hypothetical protein
LVGGVVQRIILATVAAVVLACDSAPWVPPVAVNAPPGTTPGAPLLTPLAPDPAACAALIRGDIDGAIAVRRLLATFVPELAADRAAATRAAGDPDADLERYGVPLMPAELDQLDAAGVSFDFAPLALHLDLLRDRFGGRWIDPPGTNLTVALTDPALVLSLRCYEPEGSQVRYVQAGWSLTQLGELRQRIEADWESGRLAEEGIEVLSLAEGVEGNRYVLFIGVGDASPTVRHHLRLKYGEAVVTVAGQMISPASSRRHDTRSGHGPLSKGT